MKAYICQYCGKDTSTVDYDYLNGYDHLSCALEQEQKQQYVKMEYGPGDAVIDRPPYKIDEYDCCILCGKETVYKRSTHIDMRHGYVEGAGQLCASCYSRGTEHGAIAVDYNIILGTPNDQELGAKVRKLYWERKN